MMAVFRSSARSVSISLQSKVPLASEKRTTPLVGEAGSLPGSILTDLRGLGKGGARGRRRGGSGLASLPNQPIIHPAQERPAQNAPQRTRDLRRDLRQEA